MKIEYDAAIVERTVSLAARTDERLERAVHAATDPLYALPLGQEREARFMGVYLDLFRRLEVDEFLDQILEDVDPEGMISASVGNCLVQQAFRQRDESAELYVRFHDDGRMPPHRTLIIRARPESLLDADSWRPVMLRELKHVVDMLDPGFGYRKEMVDDIPARQNLIRDRYRIFWDLFVEDRLTRAGLLTESRLAWLEEGFRRVFSIRDHGFRIDAVVNALRSSPVTHQRLLDWAQQPDSVLRNAADITCRVDAFRNDSCPICGFPTYDWFCWEGPRSQEAADCLKALRPLWDPRKGACRQCVEILLPQRTADDALVSSAGTPG